MYPLRSGQGLPSLSSPLVNYLGANVLIPLSGIGLDTTIIMGSILVIVLALVVLGAVAALVASIQSFLKARRVARGEVIEEEEEFVPSEGGCCGNHLTCEHDSLLAAVSPEIVYYDDEELDRYRGITAEGYTDRQVEEFREILLSLDEDDVPGWVRSLQLRGIEFPETLRPELYLIVVEQRDYHAIVGRHASEGAALGKA